MCFTLRMPSTAGSVTAIHQDEVLTGEAVALDVQPVGYFLSALGAFVDFLLGILLLLLYAWVATWAFGSGLLDPDVAPIVTIVVLVLVLVVIPTAVETASRGRSLGRFAVGSRIVRADGGSAGFRQAFIRALVGVFEIWFTFGAGAAIVGAFTPRSQRLGDLVAGTYAQRTRTPKLPPFAPPVPPPLAEWARIADVARLPDRLARRIAQFTRNADALEPGARARLAASLATEAAAHVSPVPPSDPETFVRAVAAVRRDRELRAITLENQRVARLTAGAADGVRGFPER